MNTENTTQEGIWVPIAQIIVPEDARPHTQEDVNSRAVSMAREGQEQNALLSKEGDKLMLVYGHGRLLSAQKLGWEKLRCDIKEGLTESQKLLMTLSENNEREAATPVYTAQLYARLMKSETLDQRGLASKLDKDESLIGKYLSLNELTPEVRENWNRFQFGLRQCLELAKLPKPEEQIQLAQECAEKDYSVRELQARVKQLLNPTKAGAEAPAKPAAEVKPFQFRWKDGKLQVQAVYDPGAGNIFDFTCGLEHAYNAFVDLHPAPASKPKAQEVSQAA